MVSVSIFFIRIYQYILSPDHGMVFFNRTRVCRFFPSCSSYTIEALRMHGFLRGWWYGIGRIIRCHPWQKGGYDLPPSAGN